MKAQSYPPSAWVLYVLYKRDRKRIREFLDGLPDQRGAWEETGIDSVLVDALLTVIFEEFDFDPDYRFRLSPDDTLMTAYRIEYDKEWMPDGFELENIIQELEQDYRIAWPLDDDGRAEDLTLLEVAHMIEAQGVSPD